MVKNTHAFTGLQFPAFYLSCLTFIKQNGLMQRLGFNLATLLVHHYCLTQNTVKEVVLCNQLLNIDVNVKATLRS